MQRFDPNSFYKLSRDQRILDNEKNLVATPTEKGRELISQYYEKKYGTRITFPVESVDDLNFYTDMFTFVTNFKKYLSKSLSTVEAKKGDYRLAFLLGGQATHAIPIIYIKEGGKEAILYADTKGINIWAIKELRKELSKNTKIKVYGIKDKRQADMYSCYTDALVFARDVTARDSKGSYRIPKLLELLEAREKKEEGYYSTKLPDELLKTSQFKEFTNDHSQRSERTIHKNETLDQFGKRYAESVDLKIHGKEEIEKKVVSSYLRKKGLKFADIIEIQFYINELSREAGKLWNDSIRKEFIIQAKKILRTQQLSDKNKRLGLHEFSEQFLVQLKNTTKDHQKEKVHFDKEKRGSFAAKSSQVRSASVVSSSSSSSTTFVTSIKVESEQDAVIKKNKKLTDLKAYVEHNLQSLSHKVSDDNHWMHMKKVAETVRLIGSWYLFHYPISQRYGLLTKHTNQGVAIQLQELFLTEDENATLEFAKENGIKNYINSIEKIFVGLGKNSELKALLTAVLDKVQTSGIVADLTSIKGQKK